MNSSRKKILIIKWGALGDLVASTPAIKTLRENFPNAHITLFTNNLMNQIIPPGFWADDHIIINTIGNKIEDSIFNQLKLFFELRRKKFDIAVNLRWTSERAALITFMSGSKTRISSGPKNMMWVYTNKIIHPVGHYHEIHRNLDIVKALGLAKINEAPEVYISDSNKTFADNFFEKNKLSSCGVVCIHPGASKPVRAWMPERFAEIGKLLSDKYKLKIVVTWGEKEKEIATNVVQMIGGNAVLCDETKTIGDLSAIINKCNMFFSNCTGPMNVAVAVKTPVVALLGSSDETDWGAYGKEHTNIKSPLRLEQYTDEDEKRAMEAITVEHVWKIISEKWEQLNYKNNI